MSVLSIKPRTMQRGNIRSIFHCPPPPAAPFAGLIFFFPRISFFTTDRQKHPYLASVAATVPSSCSPGDIIRHAITTIHATGSSDFPIAPQSRRGENTSDGFPIPAWFIGTVLRFSCRSDHHAWISQLLSRLHDRLHTTRILDSRTIRRVNWRGWLYVFYGVLVSFILLWFSPYTPVEHARNVLALYNLT